MSDSEIHEITHIKKRAMIAALAKTGNITVAAKAAKIERKSHYNWLAEDFEYAEAAKEALDAAADLLEEEARRRAFTGVSEPVYQGGQEVGTIKRYSDTLLIFLLKGNKPDKFRDRTDIRHSGSIATSRVDLTKLPQDRLDDLEALLNEAIANDTSTGSSVA